MNPSETVILERLVISKIPTEFKLKRLSLGKEVIYKERVAFSVTKENRENTILCS